MLLELNLNLYFFGIFIFDKSFTLLISKFLGIMYSITLPTKFILLLGKLIFSCFSSL